MTFIVTGASSGIGFAVASALLQQGVSVFAVARSDKQLKQLGSVGSGSLTIVVADLSTDDGINSVVQSVSAIEHLTGIVHAAGSRIDLGCYSQLDKNKMGFDFQVHVAAPIEINNRLVEKLVGSRILFIDSYSAASLRVGWSGYSIVKAAAQMAAKAAVEELKYSDIIRVFPGAVRTPLVEAVLSSEEISPVVELFQQLDAAGEINAANTIGQYVVNILLNASSGQLAEREFWDFNNINDQIFLK